MVKANLPQVVAHDLKTDAHPFFKCGMDTSLLLSIREGIPVDDALMQAICLLESADQILYDQVEKANGNCASTLGALSLLDIVKGILNSCYEATAGAARANAGNSPLQPPSH